MAKLNEIAAKLFEHVKQRLLDAPGEIAEMAVNKVEHGSHEAAAAVFNGSAYVMYPHAGKNAEQAQDVPQTHGLGTEQPDHGLGNKAAEPKPPEPGLEM